MCKQRSLQSDFTDGILVLYKSKGIMEGCHDSQISHRTKAAGKESTSPILCRWTKDQPEQKQNLYHSPLNKILVKLLQSTSLSPLSTASLPWMTFRPGTIPKSPLVWKAINIVEKGKGKETEQDIWWMNDFLLTDMNNKILKPNCSRSSIGRVGGAHHLPIKNTFRHHHKVTNCANDMDERLFPSIVFFKHFAWKENFLV